MTEPNQDEIARAADLDFVLCDVYRKGPIDSITDARAVIAAALAEYRVVVRSRCVENLESELSSWKNRATAYKSMAESMARDLDAPITKPPSARYLITKPPSARYLAVYGAAFASEALRVHHAGFELTPENMERVVVLAHRVAKASEEAQP